MRQAVLVADGAGAEGGAAVVAEGGAADEDGAEGGAAVVAVGAAGGAADAVEDGDGGGAAEGGPEWCTCSHCSEMTRDEERICCGGYPDSCVSTLPELMSVMEDGDPIMIFASYPAEMASFLDGMKSRIAFHFNFPDFSVSELASIIRNNVGNKGLRLTNQANQDLETTIENNSTKEQRNEMNGRLARQTKDTHYVESFNNALLIYHDKRICFGKESYLLRINLTVLDWIDAISDLSSVAAKVATDLVEKYDGFPLSIITRSRNLKEKYQQLFSLYAACHHSFTTAKPLTEEDKSALDTAIKKFMQFYRQQLPTNTIPIKMHLLAAWRTMLFLS
ncbi:Hypp9414 [Branchiostoma lanceolatum]|uniref:Hypp9414 protein n=1 Tax=Branchiostoma lanceolatum TaxID=7740 RepID=A0A8S4MLT1_BRALA|nr:Hypp9414 [Branchiostoma lanceolatum]